MERPVTVLRALGDTSPPRARAFLRSMHPQAKLPGVAGDRALTGTGHTSHKEGTDE
jgi:hypothetical protein